MTLVEFIAPLLKGPHQARVLAVLYFRERYEAKTSLTVDEIRQSLRSAKVKGWQKTNIADVLSRTGSLAHTSGSDGSKNLWSLTDSGREHVRQKLNLPSPDVEIEHDIGTLSKVLEKVTDKETSAYLEEGIKCLQIGALRACVVFLWAGAIRSLQEMMLSDSGGALNAAVQKHDPKARTISKIEDFAYIKDSISLLGAMELSILDKNQKDTLTECLGLRNRCSHPGKYRPGVKKVSAFIEDLCQILFT